jgi:quercetin dioxygenase-like cupin family protein
MRRNRENDAKESSMIVRNVEEFPRETVGDGEGAERQVLIGPDVNPTFAMRRFIMQPGGGMPKHTNTVEHQQYVLRGRARVSIGDDVHEVSAGTVVYIPAGVPHDYHVEGDEPFEFLCMVPNSPKDKVEILG